MCEHKSGRGDIPVLGRRRRVGVKRCSGATRDVRNSPGKSRSPRRPESGICQDDNVKFTGKVPIKGRLKRD